LSDTDDRIPTLRTTRLILRRRVADDATALFPTMSNAEAMHWWSRAPFTSEAELRDYFAAEGSGWRGWAITRVGQDRAIGFVAAGGERHAGVSEIGYLLARDAWGRGIAREAVGAIIDQLFAEGDRRVFADTDPDNTASNVLLHRLGFRREGLLREEWHTHIGVRDSVIWGLLKREWRVSSSASTRA